MITKLSLALVSTMIAFAQGSEAFEVASIRPSSAPKAKGSSYLRFTTQGVEAAAFDLRGFIVQAYDIPVGRLSVPDSRHQRLLDGTYDLIAKAEQPVPKERLRLMLQTLLADRFKLTVRRESRRDQVYRLVAAKQGPKLPQPVPEGGNPRIAYQPTGLDLSNVTMPQFCERLSLEMDRPVLDSTGIQGVYTFSLKIDGMPPKKGMVSGDLSTSSIFTDLPQQLGLQLMPDKAPLEYIIVEHVEQPSAN